jgi:hypothetical protein
MATRPLHHHDIPDDEPEMPVEPDKGPTPPAIPEDPENGRVLDPLP